jgi:hypothetical protein
MGGGKFGKRVRIILPYIDKVKKIVYCWLMGFYAQPKAEQVPQT